MTLFTGKNTAPAPKAYEQLPDPTRAQDTHPSRYRASDELVAAVNVALVLGMPLLLTGEPGCGKSELARRIAWEMDFPAYDRSSGKPLKPGEPVIESSAERFLKYVVKSTTEATDLFYHYDSVGRFHAAQLKQEVEAKDYLHLQALGLALARAKGKNSPELAPLLSDKTKAELPEAPHRSVVLIDEIDKAQRDVPNDILNEIENMEFTVRELNAQRVVLGSDQSDASGDEKKRRPLVIITSNSERDLPKAFLRRCVYFHVPFPPFARQGEVPGSSGVTVEEIVASRLTEQFGPRLPQATIDEALDFCYFLRETNGGRVNPPGMAEVLAWLRALSNAMADTLGAGSDNNPDLAALREWNPAVFDTRLASTLFKRSDDITQAKALFDEWSANAKTPSPDA